MPPSLRAAYDARLESGELTPDAGQSLALDRLDRLLKDLQIAERPALFRKGPPPRGLYLWGPVGRGKSMLMDMIFDAAPTLRKRRAHFHEFMAGVHHLMNDWRAGTPATRRARFGHVRSDDPIPPIADLIVKDAKLLCFDELQVTDIADAMILGRLFAALFERGVTLVSTSNRPPDDLYRDGINRQLFLPFIALLKAKMEIVEIAGPIDHRGVEARRRQAWFSPIDLDNEREFDAEWLETLAGAPETGVTLEVLGRKEHWPRATTGRLARPLRQPVRPRPRPGGLPRRRRGLPGRVPGSASPSSAPRSATRPAASPPSSTPCTRPMPAPGRARGRRARNPLPARATWPSSSSARRRGCGRCGLRRGRRWNKSGCRSRTTDFGSRLTVAMRRRRDEPARSVRATSLR